jgi:hypothetical protein
VVEEAASGPPHVHRKERTLNMDPTTSMKKILRIIILSVFVSCGLNEAVAQTDTAPMEEGVTAELSVKKSRWRWLTLGVYRPTNCKVEVFQLVQKKKRSGWCLWLCKTTVTVREGREANIVLDVVSNSSNSGPLGQSQVEGTNECNNASTCNFTVHRFGLPLIPNESKGHVGARAGVQRGIITRGLRCHIGNRLVLPDTHTCPVPIIE